jgi:hypothetical protein
LASVVKVISELVKFLILSMEQRTLKSVNNCLNINIYTYLGDNCW